ncbi:hypothetical protein AAFF_G00398660 [Aldrovandia affinis]|uniref:Uncharacterized protein n=1 Tax=Aldrovandia affinis TaxID=143900 RepID=A0AAD7SCN1_9TELE|nr:hypothetical protein AAFF_G00398660 [Aldrovandia affinis]
MMPRQVSLGHAPSMSAGVGLPVSYLQKAGVSVHKIVTTTDIVIPGSNRTTDVQARISAGESVHVIKGSKGTYLRTSDGRIFAMRTEKTRAGEENLTRGWQPSSSSSRVTEDQKPTPLESMPLPPSPDGPERELHRLPAGRRPQPAPWPCPPGLHAHGHRPLLPAAGPAGRPPDDVPCDP